MGDFDRSLATGRASETAISRWLQERGHLVFPAYEKEMQDDRGPKKGPQLFSASGDLVLPDLLSFRDGKVQWFEAKHKTCFSWHRISQRWVTGIDQRHYGEYQEVALRTSLPVWLLFWHPVGEPSNEDRQFGCPSQCPMGLFGNDIGVLTGCESHRSSRHGKSGMVYWAVQSLRLIAPTEAVTTAMLRREVGRG